MSIRTPPRLSRPTGTISWSDGSDFNGYAWVGLSVPTSGGTTWDGVSFPGGLGVPRAFILPIEEGEFHSQAKLYYNADLVPPVTQYKARFFDRNNVEITASAGTAFTVTASTFTIPSVTLTSPSAGSVPTPDD